jgi:3-isopropylmalate dehydrogenase
MTDGNGPVYRMGLLQGDGIGPEVVPCAQDCVDAAIAEALGARIEWTSLPFGREAIASHGAAVPEETLVALGGQHAWILGPHDSAAYPEPHRSALNPSGTVRKHFGLYANIRPAISSDGSNAIVHNTDLVIVRENSEGLYSDRNTYAGSGEFMPTPDVAVSHGITTRAATERIADVAFELAMSRRKQVTIVHKANVLKMSSGLFRTVCMEKAKSYPEVQVNEFHIDAMTVHLLRRANEFDVIVTENMFGDILSELAGEIAGSLGTAASINHSGSQAMAQAAHGSAPDIAGTGTANPIATILSSALLLRWMARAYADNRLTVAASRIEDGVAATIRSGQVTSDLGGSSSTRECARAIVASIRNGRSG